MEDRRKIIGNFSDCNLFMNRFFTHRSDRQKHRILEQKQKR